MADEQDAAYEAQLIDDIGAFTHDPYGYALYAFPWGEPGTPLEKFDGPDEWQTEILKAMGEKLRAGESAADVLSWVIQVAVSSGHGIGKSALVCIIILWAMSTMPDTRGVVTANTATQLSSKTWAELAKWYGLCINRHWFEYSKTALYSVEPGHEQTWRVDAIPWSKETSEAFAGLHNAGRRIIVIFDEASAIPPIIWEVTEGALTDEHTEIIWLAFGTPTRNDGRFHDCFFRQRKYWLTKKIDSRTARMTNKALIASQIERYGIDSDFVKVRILGEFPSASVAQFISGELITVAQERAKKLALHDVDGLPVIFGLDVARFGDDNSSLWMRQGVMTKRLFSVNGYDNIRLARLLVEHMKYEKPRAVFLDISGGLGAGVYDYLKDLGYNNIHAVNFGAKADKADRYANKRCEMYAEAKEWLIDGGCLPYEGKEAEDAAEDLAAQEYFIDRNSRTALVEKEDIKEALGRSPDDGDALVLTFAAPVAAEDGLNRLGPVAGAAPRKYDPLWRTKRR